MIDWETFKAQLKTNPGKVLKSVMLLAGCFLLIWVVVIIQSDSPQQKTIEVHDSGRLDSLQLSAEATVDSLAISSSIPQNVPSKDSGSELYVVIPIALLLFFIIAGLWFWNRSYKGSPQDVAGRAIFTTIGSQQLPGGQQLMVLKINGEYWVITTGANQGVKLLHRYAAGEWKKLEQKPAPSKGENTFWQTLQQSASSNNKKGI